MRRFGLVAFLAALLVGVPVSSHAKKDDRPVVTYTGMSVHEDRGVTLRVELSKTVPFTTKKGKKKVTFYLEGATVRQRTNLFPLVADHFGVEVLSTKLDRTKGGVKFSVAIRDDVELQTKLVEHAAGATLLVEVPPRPPAPVKPEVGDTKGAESSGDSKQNVVLEEAASAEARR